MDRSDLYPLKFRPIYKHYIWGGQNLRSMGKTIDDDEIVAESWEISDHGNDMSVVLNGSLKGKTLRDLIEQFGEDLCPETLTGRFPILIKYIDANRRLSVQVHPDDDYARVNEGPQELGKTECWYVLEAQPGAELVVGMKRGVTRKIFRDMIDSGNIEDGIHSLPVSKGDFVYIKSGTVHAIMEGILICEIQENSDSTYRLYDWGRVGNDGKPRPLHLEKAMDVITFVPEEEYEQFMSGILIPYDKKTTNRTHELVRGSFFNIDLLHYRHDVILYQDHAHFNTINLIEGECDLTWSGGSLSLRRGDTVLIPRPVEEFTLKTDNIKALRSFL
jgi:mannose-6-phosphate isomerase